MRRRRAWSLVAVAGLISAMLWWMARPMLPTFAGSGQPGDDARLSSVTRLSVLVVLESDKPVKAVPVDDLAVGCAPRPYLEVIHELAALGEPGEPVLQGRDVSSAEQGQHHSLASERGLVTGRVGGKELHRAVLEIAVRDGLSWPVGSIEAFERVQLGGAAEDTSVACWCR